MKKERVHILVDTCIYCVENKGKNDIYITPSTHLVLSSCSSWDHKLVISQIKFCVCLTTQFQISELGHQTYAKEFNQRN